jgi:hypothetical protein
LSTSVSRVYILSEICDRKILLFTGTREDFAQGQQAFHSPTTAANLDVAAMAAGSGKKSLRIDASTPQPPRLIYSKTRFHA